MRRWFRGLWLPVWLGVLTAGVFFVYQRIESNRIHRRWVAETGVMWDSVRTQTWVSLAIQDSFRFANEPLPLHGVWVRSELQDALEELLSNKELLLRMFRWQARWQEPIHKVLMAYDLPTDLAYLSCVYALEGDELNLWGFSIKEGLSYGLRIDDEVDERAEVYRATGAAALALKAHYARHEQWVCVMRAFLDKKPNDTAQTWTHWSQNCGNVSKEAEQAWVRLVAVRAVLVYPEGAQLRWLIPPNRLKPLRTTSWLIRHPIANLSRWANRHRLSYGDLVYANPWIRGHSLTPKEHPYVLLTYPAPHSY